MTAPVQPSPDLGALVGASGPAEQAEVAKAQAAIDAGHDPDAVKTILTQRIHEVRKGLATAPAEAPTGADTARGIVQELNQGLTLGAGNKLTAATRAVLPEAVGGTKGFDYSGALADENASREGFEQSHPILAPALQMAGGVLPAAAGGALLSGVAKGSSLAAPVAEASGFGDKALTTGGKALQLAGQGATFGAAQGALSSDKLNDVGTNALRSGAVGALAAPLIGGTLHIAGNLADRTGLTNLASRAASTVGADDVGEALGATGAVNQAVTPRVDLAVKLGAPDESGQTLLNNYRAETQSEAKPLYDAVRSDPTLINDPRVNEILKDPAFQKPWQRLIQQRARTDNPMPQVADLATPPDAQNDKLLKPADWRGLVDPEAAADRITPFSKPDATAARVAANQAALSKLPTGLTGMTTTEVPDIGGLHDLKKIMSNMVTRGQASSVVLNQQEAESLAPLVEELRTIMQAKSPAAKLADAYYTFRKGGEEALAQGQDFAQQGATATQGEHSPEEAQRVLQTPRNRMEGAAVSVPPDDQSRLGMIQRGAQPERQAQFQQGVKAGVMDKTGTIPVQSSQDILKLPILDQTPQAAKARAVAIPDPAERAQFEQWLTDQHQAASAAPHTGGGTGMAPFSARMAVIKGLRTVLRKPDLIQSPAGQAVVSQYATQPSLMAPAVEAAKRGGNLLDALRAASMISGANAAGRLAPVATKGATTP